jgi:hypothetical protein
MVTDISSFSPVGKSDWNKRHIHERAHLDAHLFSLCRLRNILGDFLIFAALIVCFALLNDYQYDHEYDSGARYTAHALLTRDKRTGVFMRNIVLYILLSSPTAVPQFHRGLGEGCGGRPTITVKPPKSEDQSKRYIIRTASSLERSA